MLQREAGSRSLAPSCRYPPRRGSLSLAVMEMALMIQMLRAPPPGSQRHQLTSAVSGAPERAPEASLRLSLSRRHTEIVPFPAPAEQQA